MEYPLLPPSGTLVPIGPENWLPKWLNLWVDKDSLLKKLLQQITFQTEDFKNLVRRLEARKYLTTCELGEDRLLWESSFPYSVRDGISVHFICEAGSGTVRRAISGFDFYTSLDPVWWFNSSTYKVIYRNLESRNVTLSGTSTVYTLLDETEGLVPDKDVYWKRQTDKMWTVALAGGSNLYGSALFLSVLTNVDLWYGSQYFARTLASGTVVFTKANSESISLKLNEIPPSNVFDGYGSLVGLPRLKKENNKDYKQRLLGEVQAPPDSSLNGIVRGASSRLGRTVVLNWDGITNKTLDSVGASGITLVTIPRVSQYREITEELIQQSDYTYLSAYSNWRDGWLVYVGGLPEHNVQRSGNIVTLSRKASGSVTANYYLQQYSFTTNVSGFVDTIIAGEGVSSGCYTIVLSRNARAYTVDNLNFLNDKLLSDSGLPNSLFYEVANIINATNRTAFDRSSWGQASYWFNDSEPKSGISYLSMQFDSGLES